MKTCSNCGNPNEDNAKLCNQCGHGSFAPIQKKPAKNHTVLYVILIILIFVMIFWGVYWNATKGARALNKSAIGIIEAMNDHIQGVDPTDSKFD